MANASRKPHSYPTPVAMMLMSVLVFLNTGCAKEPTTDNQTNPHWVARQTPHTPHSKTAVVFVHGIFGDTDGTWTAADGSTSFFKLISDDPTVGSFVDVYAFGFTSKMFGSGSFDIQQAADKMNEYLVSAVPENDYDQLVFVGHSMGGLVILRYLVTYRPMDRVPLVVLYSTPQEGAQIANIANIVVGNPALAEMIKGDKNVYLSILNSEWKAIKGARPHVVCAYETENTHGFLIVGRGSANYFCDDPGSPIAVDHINIVKPTKSDDQAVIVLVNALNRYAVGPQYAAKLETPDFETIGDRSMFVMAGNHVARLKNSGFRPLTWYFGAVSAPNRLYIVPEDAPLPVLAGRRRYGINPSRTANVDIVISLDAPVGEKYSFVLSSSVTADQTVDVQIPERVANEHRLKQAQSVTAQINAMLLRRLAARSILKPAHQCGMSEKGGDDATNELVQAVRHGLAAVDPDLGTAAQLVSAADFLNSINWSPLSAIALQKLEREAPASAVLPSVAALEASVSARSGIEHIFKGTDERQGAGPARDLASRDHIFLTPALSRASAELALRMQGVPTLAYYGWSLQGDLLWTRGDLMGARQAYEAAAQLRSNPSISSRLQEAGAATPTAKTPAISCPSAMPLDVTDSHTAPDGGRDPSYLQAFTSSNPPVPEDQRF